MSPERALVFAILIVLLVFLIIVLGDAIEVR
jgi:hypothetical protein